MATPCEWTYMDDKFGKQAPQHSEIFWETVDMFVSTLVHRILSGTFIDEIAYSYAASMHDEVTALSNVRGLIDGTLLAIDRPGKHGLQTVVYNGHKRKHAL